MNHSSTAPVKLHIALLQATSQLPVLLEIGNSWHNLTEGDDCSYLVEQQGVPCFDACRLTSRRHKLTYCSC